MPASGSGCGHFLLERPCSNAHGLKLAPGQACSPAHGSLVAAIMAGRGHFPRLSSAKPDRQTRPPNQARTTATAACAAQRICSPATNPQNNPQTGAEGERIVQDPTSTSVPSSRCGGSLSPCRHQGPSPATASRTSAASLGPTPPAGLRRPDQSG